MTFAQLQKYLETIAVFTADCSLDSSKKLSVLKLGPLSYPVREESWPSRSGAPKLLIVKTFHGQHVSVNAYPDRFAGVRASWQTLASRPIPSQASSPSWSSIHFIANK